MAEIDPDAVLKEIRFFVAQRYPDVSIIQALANGDRLALLVGQLDEWMSESGSPPEDWRPRRPDQAERNAAGMRAVERFYDSVKRQAAQAQIDAQVERLRQGSADRAEMDKRSRRRYRGGHSPREED